MSITIFYNAKIQTQDHRLPLATAIAIQGKRILAIGSDSDVRALANSKTVEMNLGGRLVLPGLTDSHFHYYEWALGRQRLVLTTTSSIAELQTLLARKARETMPGAWIIGRGWNENNWSSHRLITRADLDNLTPVNPTMLLRGDGHLAVANSLALKAAHIDNETLNPPQGVIDRDATGQPTGVLRELAINLVRQVIPLPTEDETVKTMRDGFNELHKLGLTGIHDFRSMGGKDGPPAFRAYQHLQATGELAMRMWMLLPGERLEHAIALGLRTGLGDDYLRVGHVKFFADGGQGVRSAWMLETYEDTHSFGMPLVPMDEILDALQHAHTAGLALAVHAIGDRANRELVTVFEQALKSDRSIASGTPHRIEHAQNIRPEDIIRLGRLGVVASVQPIHLPDDISMIEQSIGPRGCWSYPFQDMLAAGVPLAFGSDCPVANPNPMWGIHAAVTRRRQDGTPPGGWYPEQCLTVDQAVHGFTTPGKLADLVVLDRDIFSIDPMEIFDTKPVMTVFDGQIVYEV
jgi:predicted amidohydrolase YtcJ